MQQSEQQNGGYTFVSEPQPLGSRPKYRDSEEKMADSQYTSANIMYDPRVVRGKTLGRPIAAQTSAAVTPRQTARESVRAQKEQKQHLIRTGAIRPVQKTIQELHDNIVVVKKRVEVPLHLYLEEQSDPVLTTDANTETDEFLEEPERPVYQPKKTGVDVAVQVEPERVFQFDSEVQPLLQVIVSKVLEQSLMEVREEEEFRNMRTHKFELEMKAEMEEKAARQREEEERQLFLQKEARIAEARKQVSQEKELQRKMESAALATNFLRGLQNVVFDELEKKGYFYDPVQKQVEAFMPWVVEQVALKLKNVEAARRMVDELINTSVSKIQAEAKQEADRRRQAREKAAREAEVKRLADEELARRNRRVQLFIHTNIVAQSPVGPIHLSASSTVGQVEDKIVAWMAENLDESEIPARERLKFLWNSKLLDKANILYELGIETLSTIEMQLEPLPRDPNADNDNEGDEGDEGDDDTPRDGKSKAARKHKDEEEEEEV